MVPSCFCRGLAESKSSRYPCFLGGLAAAAEAEDVKNFALLLGPSARFSGVVEGTLK